MVSHRVRSVVKDIVDFCGWDYLLQLESIAAPGIDEGFIAALFLTGGRVSEVCSLKKEHFLLDHHKEFIIVDGMPIVKTRKPDNTRTFPINKSEPLVPYLLEWIRTVRKDNLFFFDRRRGLERIRRIGARIPGKVPFSKIDGTQLYPHWFRAMRARQLKADYGFDSMALASFFHWELPELGVLPTYTRLGWSELAKLMKPN